MWAHSSKQPLSNKHPTILAVVEQFSFAQAPLGKDTVELVLLHIFWLHGFPSDVVSYQRPQFMSVPACHQNSTLNLTARLSAITRRWKRLLGVWSWSQQLLWVEYTHNTLTSSGTGMFGPEEGNLLSLCTGLGPPLPLCLV